MEEAKEALIEKVIEKTYDMDYSEALDFLGINLNDLIENTIEKKSIEELIELL